MTIREIPKSYEYVCDVCGEAHTQHNANGLYSYSCPPRWAWLKLEQSGEWADESRKLLLCERCKDTANKFVNGFVKSEGNVVT